MMMRTTTEDGDKNKEKTDRSWSTILTVGHQQNWRPAAGSRPLFAFVCGTHPQNTICSFISISSDKDPSPGPVDQTGHNNNTVVINFLSGSVFSQEDRPSTRLVSDGMSLIKERAKRRMTEITGYIIE
jgi:hypothetical protein